VWVDGAVKERERRRQLPEQRGEGGHKGGGGGRAGGEGAEDEALVWAEEERVGGWVGEGDKADEWVPPEVVEMELRYKGRWMREK
jgi:hypothetical protein